MKLIETVGAVNLYSMAQDFGKIYTGNNPTHGVYREADLAQHGERASAVAHHWTALAAFSCVHSQNILEGVPHAVVAYNKI